MASVVTLRDIRKAKGMSIDDVSRAGGPKSATYTKIDTGKADVENITVKSLLQICYVFDMTPNELLTTLGLDWRKLRY
jgi:DNA-binding Xre family transcriptional regulator